MDRMKKCLAVVLIITLTLSLVSCNRSSSVDIPENSTGTTHDHETSEEMTLPESTEGEESSSVQMESEEETESIETEDQTSVTDEETTVPEETIEDSVESSEEEPPEVSTEFSTEVPTGAPTEAPTEPPTKAPTEAPAESPTAAPEIEETEHQHRYTERIIVNGCIQLGYTTYTCACGHSYVSNYVPAKGHNWSDWVTIVEPTATSDGKEQRICSVCKETQRQTLNKLEEDASSHTCAVFHPKYITKPTCFEDGLVYYVCQDCGAEKIDKETGERFTLPVESYGGHKMYVSYTCEATCAGDGYQTYSCQNCDYTYDEITQYATNHSNSTIVRVEPTCVPGYQEITCNDCGWMYSYTELPAVKEHEYKSIFVYDLACLLLEKGYYSCTNSSGKTTNVERVLLNYAPNEVAIDYCVNCLEEFDIEKAYLPFTAYEIAEKMLVYINELRESYYGTSEYNLVVDEALNEYAMSEMFNCGYTMTLLNSNGGDIKYTGFGGISRCNGPIKGFYDILMQYSMNGEPLMYLKVALDTKYKKMGFFTFVSSTSLGGCGAVILFSE